MSLEQTIQFVNEQYPAVLWWQQTKDNEPAFVAAGQRIPEPLVVTEFTRQAANTLQGVLSDTYHEVQLADMNEGIDARAEARQIERHLRPIGILVEDGFIEVNFPAAAVESVARLDRIEWLDAALNALKYVRHKVMEPLYAEDETYTDEGSGVALHQVQGTEAGTVLGIPHMVINPVGCSCIGLDPMDRGWSDILETGWISLYQHNVDSYLESLPLAAGFAAINTLIVSELMTGPR